MDIHSKLQTLDFLIIGGYILALITIGMWVSFRRRGAEDLFLGGRSQGWGVVGLSIFGTNVNPSFLISSCSIAYASGLAAANFEWLAWWLMMLLAMLFVPYYMNTRVSTMPEFINRRFGRGPYTFLSYYALFTTLVSWLGAVLYTGGLLFSFTGAGGLAAVMITDAFQTILMIAGAAALTIIALYEVGGISRLAETTPESYWQLIRPTNDADYPWHAMLLGYPVMGIWFWCTDQTIVQRVLGARNLRHGQLGIVFAAFLKILPPFLFMLPGILCFILHPGLEDPDEAFTTMVVNHLPVGMVGLIVAVLIAALISTIDSGLNSFSTILTLDIYKKTFRPDATPIRIKWIGRVVTILAAAIAIACALMMDTFERGLFDMIQSIIAFIAPPVAAVFLVGVLWRRATSSAALLTLIVGSTASISIGICHLNDWPSKEFWPHYMLLSFYIFAGICLFMAIASLLTRNCPNEERLPSLKQAYAQQGSRSTSIWLLWAVLAAIMAAIYFFFD